MKHLSEGLIKQRGVVKLHFSKKKDLHDGLKEISNMSQ